MVRVKKRSICQYMVRCNHVNVAIGLRAGEQRAPRRQDSLLPVGREGLCQPVVTCEPVDTRLNQNKAELGVLVLPVALHVLAHGDGLLHEEVQVLGDGGLLACLSEKGRRATAQYSVSAQR